MIPTRKEVENSLSYDHIKGLKNTNKSLMVIDAYLSGELVRKPSYRELNVDKAIYHIENAILKLLEGER